MGRGERKSTVLVGTMEVVPGPADMPRSWVDGFGTGCGGGGREEAVLGQPTVSEYVLNW